VWNSPAKSGTTVTTVVTGRSRTWGRSEEGQQQQQGTTTTTIRAEAEDSRATAAIEEAEPSRSNLNPKP